MYVIPTKNGMWRAVRMTHPRHKWWQVAWRNWWEKKGSRLANSPEMWVEK